ncbi:P-loop containing nucleoside triphosphate hydrolase protein [Neurospora intermedia]|uniref:P-loop containing nucleoside triphosphate hydrolase protein n=1 Tax=Neurospora intermedia TaxID=5142 RepID=A0ABR3CXW1_NEUIN
MASSTLSWTAEGPFDLYCKKTGQSHAVLTAFGYWKCPRCDQSLNQPKIQISDRESDQDSSSDKVEPAQSKSDNFSYSVRYVDDEHHLIYSEPWQGPFDLHEARKCVLSLIQTKPILRVETVLETCIPGDMDRHYYEAEKIKASGILNNPLVDVAVWRIAVTIMSPVLVQAIRKLVSYDPSEDLHGRTLGLGRHHELVWHHLDDFKKYIEQPDEDNGTRLAKPHLRQLLALVASINAFVVLSCVYYDARKEMTRDGSVPRPRGWKVGLCNLDYDGSYVGRKAGEVYLPPFEGERRITALNIIPAKYKDEEDGGKLRDALMKDGKRWFELLRGRQVSYSGGLLDDKKRELQGRVYVDTASYYNIESASHADDASRYRDDAAEKDGRRRKKEQSQDATFRCPPRLGDIDDMGRGFAKCPCEQCHGFRPHPPHGFPWTDYNLLNPHKLEVSDLKLPDHFPDPEHRYLVCNQSLFGFDLRSRNWLMVDVRFCKDLKRNTTAINTLVLQDETKNMIKALIQKYSGDTKVPGAPTASWRADHIENKGEGQIFLLHGSPGVGKTFYIGRPLLSLTCADIGTEDVSMEKKLMKWFQLAEKWGAVMLIDEADVFLEKRVTADLKRNSLVSVFLRCVKYYRGVLFLTTNRVGQFDDAFMSRIHVVIHYKSLTPQDRKKIWRQFFKKLSSERTDFRITRRAQDYVLEDKDITSMSWNGREIRNAFQTAVALADFRFMQIEDKDENDVPTLDQENFEEVCNMMIKFKDYLKDLHGKDEDERAHKEFSRGPVFGLDD